MCLHSFRKYNKNKNAFVLKHIYIFIYLLLGKFVQYLMYLSIYSQNFLSAVAIEYLFSLNLHKTINVLEKGLA